MLVCGFERLKTKPIKLWFHACLYLGLCDWKMCRLPEGLETWFVFPNCKLAVRYRT